MLFQGFSRNCSGYQYPFWGGPLPPRCRPPFGTVFDSRTRREHVYRARAWGHVQVRRSGAEYGRSDGMPGLTGNFDRMTGLTGTVLIRKSQTMRCRLSCHQTLSAIRILSSYGSGNEDRSNPFTPGFKESAEDTWYSQAENVSQFEVPVHASDS